MTVSAVAVDWNHTGFRYLMLELRQSLNYATLEVVKIQT